MEKFTPKKNTLTSEINRIVSQGMTADTGNDAAALQDLTFSWDDLNTLKDDLGNTVLGFMGEVQKILTNTEVIAKLGGERAHFEKLVAVFFNDLTAFSGKIKDLRVQHEHRTGRITDLDGFNLYNRLSITYHSLYEELSMLMAPTLSDLVLTISKVTAAPNETTQPEATHVQ